ncbi:MAG: recombinase XerC [Variovorax paradoxus]|nr:MAG: recombinase XerC [Variovorax paradoxus]PZQ09654.1 MAG: recombinase XerC [Variovorax paradoxus]
MTDEELVARYLEYQRVERRLAENTLTAYQLNLAKLQAHARKVPVALALVQHAHVRRWASQLHSKGRSTKGIALTLSSWRGFYTWLGKEGGIPSNPVRDVRPPKGDKPLPKALGVDEAVQLAEFKAEADNPWLEARDAAMVALLYGAGLRVAEMTGLDARASSKSLGWIDLDAGEVHVLGKGSKPRSVPMGSYAVKALQHWLAVRGEANALNPALFIGKRGTRLTSESIWQRLRRRSQLAGLATPVHPHMLRHSFASHILQSSGDLRGVQELLGHSKIATTQVYTRLDFQHLATSYDSAHPRAKRKPAE